MDNEELKNDPISTLNKVEHFLGLEHFITDKMMVLNKNKGEYCIQSTITDTGWLFILSIEVKRNKLWCQKKHCQNSVTILRVKTSIF